MSIYSDKCKRTPTAEGVVPCFMCPGECVGDPASPEENERLCNEWAARVAPNPIVYQDGGYYFSNETWSDLHGPFPTIHAARIQLLGYLYHLDFGPFTWLTMLKNIGPMWRTALWVAKLPDPRVP